MHAWVTLSTPVADKMGATMDEPFAAPELEVYDKLVTIFFINNSICIRGVRIKEF